MLKMFLFAPYGDVGCMRLAGTAGDDVFALGADGAVQHFDGAAFTPWLAPQADEQAFRFGIHAVARNEAWQSRANWSNAPDSIGASQLRRLRDAVATDIAVPVRVTW